VETRTSPKVFLKIKNKNKNKNKIKGVLLVYRLVHQRTPTDIINITTKTNEQEIVLLEVCTKSFCWPSFLAY
jgi:hypothetical protein